MNTILSEINEEILQIKNIAFPRSLSLSQNFTYYMTVTLISDMQIVSFFWYSITFDELSQKPIKAFSGKTPDHLRWLPSWAIVSSTATATAAMAIATVATTSATTTSSGASPATATTISVCSFFRYINS